MNRLAVKVSKAAERMIRKEHPWVFENSIKNIKGDGQAGDLAIIYDNKKNNFLALGLYDPFSPIQIKLIQFKKPAKIDATWFDKKVKQAFEKRLPILLTDTNSYRLIHGENDGLPGLIADVYADVLVLKLYSPIWLPFVAQIVSALVNVSTVKTIVLRMSRNLQQRKELLKELHEGKVIHGTLEKEEIIFKEHGLKFSANVIRGHKTGFFLDHRHNRKRVGELSKGKSVLDVFSYAGGFSVHALAGGAKEVTSLDISAQALEMAKKNVMLNVDNPRHKTLAQDAFEGLEQLFKQGKRFDLVIVDPPSFAKKEEERERALNSYFRLAALAVRLVNKGGVLLLASCSSRVKADEFFEASIRALDRSGRKYKELERTFHDIDHPIGFPEGAYLKAVYFQLLDD